MSNPQQPSQTQTHFDVVSFMVVTAFSEKSMSNHPVDIEHIQYRIGVLNTFRLPPQDATLPGKTHLGQTSSEDNNLVNLPHFLQEMIHPRSFDNIDVMGLRLDLNGDDVVGRRQHLNP